VLVRFNDGMKSLREAIHKNFLLQYRASADVCGALRILLLMILCEASERHQNRGNTVCRKFGNGSGSTPTHGHGGNGIEVCEIFMCERHCVVPLLSSAAGLADTSDVHDVEMLKEVWK